MHLGVEQCFPNCVQWKIFWCTASIFKVLHVDTNFLPKLRKCCHLVMVDFCRKSRVAFQVSSIEMKTFFWRLAPFWVPSRDSRRSLPREMMISKKKAAPFSLSSAMPLNINWNRFQWLVGREICQLIPCAGRQKSLGTTGAEEAEI